MLGEAAADKPQSPQDPGRLENPRRQIAEMILCASWKWFPVAAIPTRKNGRRPCVGGRSGVYRWLLLESGARANRDMWRIIGRGHISFRSKTAEETRHRNLRLPL